MKSRSFSGELKLNEGCACSLLESKDKSFYHVYHIGQAIKPKVIQGIFSGVTSGNIPIGGRCILVRQEAEFESLSNERIALNPPDKQSSELDKALSNYFQKYSDNNLIIKSSIGFDWDDLLR